MKKIISIIFFTFISISTSAQVNGVGINKENPEAALDIKAANTSDEILRFSTPPSSMSSDDNDFVFFVGDPVSDGGSTVAYDLRSLTLTNFTKKMNSIFPSLNKVTLTNKLPENINNNNDFTVTLNKILINTNDEVFELNTANNSLKFIKGGTYQITSFVGFKQLESYEGDILIIIGKKGASENDFSDYKATIVSRTKNKSSYTHGTGVGSSFSFVNEFEAGDEIRLEVKKYIDKKLRLNEFGTTMSATLVSPKK